MCPSSDLREHARRGKPYLENVDFGTGLTVPVDEQFGRSGTKARSNRWVGRRLQRDPFGYATNVYEYRCGRAVVATDSEGLQRPPRLAAWTVCASGQQVCLDAG